MLGDADGLEIAMVNTMPIQKNTCLWNSSSGQSSRDLLSCSLPASTFQKNCPKKHISNVPVAARLHAIPIAPSTPGATTKPHSFASPVISNGYVPGRHASVSLALLLQVPDLERDQVALALLCCLPSFRRQACYWCTRMHDPFFGVVCLSKSFSFLARFHDAAAPPVWKPVNACFTASTTGSDRRFSVHCVEKFERQ